MTAMSIRCSLLLLVALSAGALLAAGCGDDDSTSSAATTAPVTTPAATTPSTTSTATTTASTTSTTPTTVAATAPAVVEIVVDADTAAAAPLTEMVALGQQVRIVIRSAIDQEFHIHGYDIEDSGTEVVFEFTADMPGEFGVESHDSGDLLLTLSVDA
jgi:hypothetical protein